MKTMQPALRNGRNIWDPINMPREEFLERIRKVREGMKQRGIDCLLAYGNAFDECANPCYFSNYVIRLPKGFMVAIPRQGEPTLFFEGASRGLPSARMITWIQDVRACPDVAGKCVEYLKEKDLIPGTIGDGGLKRLMPHHQLKSLIQALEGCTILDAEDMVLDMRKIKSPREQDQVRRASRVVKHCLDLLQDKAFSNMRERAVEAYIIREARMEGAEDVRLLLGRSSATQWALGPPENAIMPNGTTMILYLALSFERYWSSAFRTYVVKDNSFSECKMPELDSLFRDRVAKIRPGISVSEWCKETMTEITRHGGDFLLGFGLGSGVGLSPVEKPLMEIGSSEDFREGMCISVRLGQKDKALGDVMLGDTFLITQTDTRCLTV